MLESRVVTLEQQNRCRDGNLVGAFGAPRGLDNLPSANELGGLELEEYPPLPKRRPLLQDCRNQLYSKHGL